MVTKQFRLAFQTAFTRKDNIMNLHLSIGPILALVSGIIILVIPRLLNIIVAIYLIVIGVLGILGYSGLNLR
jgi:hypothetical protein